MKFINQEEKTADTPVILGWVRSINGVQLLWETLLKEVPGTTFLELGRINLDTLANLFASIRSKCGATPTASQFVSALSLLDGQTNINSRDNIEAEHQTG